LSQSTLIALAIVLLFVVYVTARGRLPAYMQVFGLARGTGGDSTTTDGGGGFTLPSWLTERWIPYFGGLGGLNPFAPSSPAQ